MNPGPQLHRSLTFWAGLIVITFTCWAWWDSCHHDSLLYWKQLSAQSRHHALKISRENLFHLRRIDTARRPSGHLFHGRPRDVFPAPFLVHAEKALPFEKPSLSTPLKEVEQLYTNTYGPGSWCLFLPYWLILLTLLLTWTALLFLRARRRRRALVTPPLDPIPS